MGNLAYTFQMICLINWELLFLFIFQRGFETSLLGNIFSHAVVGNSLVAIGSGLIAQKVADYLGYV